MTATSVDNLVLEIRSDQGQSRSPQAASPVTPGGWSGQQPYRADKGVSLNPLQPHGGWDCSHQTGCVSTLGRLPAGPR